MTMLSSFGCERALIQGKNLKRFVCKNWKRIDNNLMLKRIGMRPNSNAKSSNYLLLW